MTLRAAFQYAAFILNALILALSVIGFVIRPDKRPSLILWFLFGSVGSIFYVNVLLFGQGTWGNEVSPLRSLIQYTLVASALLYPTVSDLVRRWKR